MLGLALPERAAKLTTKGERFESSFHHQILLTLGRVNLRTFLPLVLCVGERGGFCFVFEQEVVF